MDQAAAPRLRSIAYLGAPGHEGEFPFCVPAVRALGTLELRAPVTLLVGENGSGKSTLLEAVACATDLPAAGGEQLARDPSLEGARRLAGRLRLTWSARNGRGFFMRAEDFFRYVRRLHDERRELEADAAHFDRTLTGYGRQLARGVALGQKGALDARYGGDLEARSHGESFLAFFKARLVPGGLYLLDEPEAALSPQRQLALLALLRDAAAEGSQFVVATHAPVLMACPGARILSLDEQPPAEVAFEDLEHVRFMRDFLAAPGRYLRHL